MLHCSASVAQGNPENQLHLQRSLVRIHRAEYLHLVLTANRGVRLPAPTLWLLRHSKFRTLAAGDYGQLLDDVDRSMVPWLAEFQVHIVATVCCLRASGAFGGRGR